MAFIVVASGTEAEGPFTLNTYDSMYVDGTANRITVSGGVLHVNSAGLADLVYVHSGGLVTAFLGGRISQIGVYTGGKLIVTTSGMATSIMEDGGYVYVMESATVSFSSHTFSNVVLSNNSATVHAATEAKLTTVASGGIMDILGGLATKTDIVNSGQVYLYSGVAGNTNVDYGAFVLSGGIANNTSVGSAGSMFISNGAMANDITIDYTGRYHVGGVFVYHGGVVNNVIVNSGFLILSGGTTSNIVENGGYVSVGAGAIAKFATHTFSGMTLSGREATAHAGTTATDITLSAGATLYVLGGIVNNGTTYDSAAIKVIGGVANSTTIRGGDMVVSNGKANSTTVSNGVLTVSYGGVANSASVSGSYNAIRLYNGGSANDVVIDYGGGFYNNGGTATRAEINSGGSIYCNGGTTESATANYGASLYVASGGTAESATANYGGRVIVSSGGTALNIRENGGYVSVENGAVVTFAHNTFNDQAITNAIATVHSGTKANRTDINYGGTLYVFSGGIANDTTLSGSYAAFVVSSGGTAARTTIGSGGSFFVCSGGTANGITINSGGVFVSQGGTANGITLGRNGYLYLSKGAKITGNIRFDSGAVYYADTGTVLDFDLTQAKPGDDALVNDLSVVKSTTLFTITVRGNQTSGKYCLAEGASSFAGTITVQDSSGTELGTLAVGQKISVNDADYTLNLSRGKLTLDIKGANGTDTTPPTVTNIAASITAPTNQDVIVTADFTDDVEVAFAMYRIGKTGSWDVYIDGVTLTQNNTVYFKAFDVACNESEIVGCTVSNIDKVPPAAPSAAADITATTDQDVTVTAAFSNDSTRKEFSLNGTSWSLYTTPIVFEENGVVYFRGTDAAGNVSEVTGYTVSNIDKTAPVVQDTTPPTVFGVTPSTTALAESVTVTASFSDDIALAATLYRIGKNGTWNLYSGGVTMTKNDTVYFKAIDTAGNESGIVSYEVTNIGVPPQNLPDLGFYRPDEWYSTIVIAPDANQGTQQTLPDYQQLYLSFCVDNDGSVDSKPFSVETYIDGQYYRTENFQGIKSNYYRQDDYLRIGSFAAGEHTVTLKIVSDEGDAVPEDNVITRTFTVKQDSRGSFYRGYYCGNPQNLDSEMTLSLDTGKYSFSGNFIGLRNEKKVNAKILILDSNNKNVGTVTVRKGKIANNAFLLSKGDYTIRLLSTDNQKSADRISFELTGKVFYKADSNDNSIADVSNTYPYIATVRDTACSIISNGWVGPVDVLSFRQVDFEYSGKYTFTVKSSDQVKVSLISVYADSRGRSKEKQVASVSISGKKIGKEIDFGNVLLASGSYYLKVEATNAAKGTNADFSVRVNASSTIFSNGDGGWNDYLYDKKAEYPLNQKIGDFISTEIKSWTEEIQLDKDSFDDGWNNFVGFDDPVDFARITLSGDAKLSFDLTATDATKFTIYKLVAGTGKKAGTYTMKTLQTTALKKDRVAGGFYTANTKALSLDKGEYYICMESTNAKRGGSAYYRVSVNQDKSRFSDQGVFRDALDAPAAEAGLDLPEACGGVSVDAPIEPYRQDDLSGWQNIGTPAESAVADLSADPEKLFVETTGFLAAL